MSSKIGAINLDTSELDFETLKESLKTYLETQDEFTDFDFEGSAISVIIELLSYNSHMMGLYANMLSNESFIDSAVKRDSVVSHAKQIGYTPTSCKAPQAIVDVVITTTDVLSQIVIDRNTKFTTTIDGKTYTFITLKSFIAEPIGNDQYKAESVELYEGKLTAENYLVDVSNNDQRFLIRNKNADMDTLKVIVQASRADATQEFYQQVEDANILTNEDKVYFLDEVEDEKFEVSFGDDVLGKAVVDGNLVILEYLTTNKETANTASSFVLSGNIQGYTNVSLTTTQQASGGSERESIESIRRTAPKFYQAQNRAVTKNDYKTLLLANSTIANTAESVAVWGGEDNVPPKYGTVQVSIKPKTGKSVTSALKEIIKEEILESLNVLTVRVEINDPDFLYLEPTVDFEYNPNDTNLSLNELKELVTNTITNYNDNTMEFFDRNFRHSVFVNLIDETESSIQNNLTNVKIKKKTDVRLNVTTTYEINFENGLQTGSLSSSQFVVLESSYNEGDKYYFEDDEVGNIVLKKISPDLSISIINEDAGTVDYTTGEVVLTEFTPSSLIDSTELELIFNPTECDVYSVRNLILTIDPLDITINGEAVTE